MQQLQGHPFVSYGIGQDRSGTAWITMRCSRCGDTTQRPCSAPQLRAGYHVFNYATNHGHGVVRPVMPQRTR